MWFTLGMGRCSQTRHRNYLLPIDDSLEQVGVQPVDKHTPVLTADSGLLANGLIESQPGSLANSPPKQHVPGDPELTGSAASDMAYDGSQAGQDQPAPLR